MGTAENSLITVDEAQEVVVQASRWGKYRTLSMVVVGAVAVICATLLILLLFSLRGARTGLSTILPFLDRTDSGTLQLQ